MTTKHPDRAVIIMNAGRSGSSALAGALHKAGIRMAKDLIGAHPRWNPTGHFEDRVMHRMHRLLAYQFTHEPAIENETLDRYSWLADYDNAQRSMLLAMYEKALQHVRRPPIWGLKCLMLGVIWPWVAPLFPKDRRLILLERDRESVIRSKMAHSDLGRAEAERITDYLAARARESITSADCPILAVRYEHLLDYTEFELIRILEFAGKGLDVDLDLDAAIQHIKPELNHHASERYRTQ